MPRNALPLETRFWSKVDKRGPDECWPWLGSAPRGRGRISHNGEAKVAPRISWELANGQAIADGLCACHTCDNPICVNPAHIWVGTQSDNLRDMYAKGRGRGGPSQRAKTHCKRGHEYTAANTYIGSKGDRNCRSCKRTVWRGKPLENQRSA